MRSLFLTFVFLLFVRLGFSQGYILALGYMWVDLIKPQNLAYSIIVGKPLSMIMAVLMISYLFISKRTEKVSLNFTSLLLILFMIWITISTYGWAVLQGAAWSKWDMGFKSILFGCLIPYFFRTRVEIEAMLQIITLSVGTLYIGDAVKTFVGGGGYGGWTGGSGLEESSTLAMVCTAMVPINMYLRDNSVIFNGSHARTMYLGLAIFSGLTVFGTFARTGLVVLVLYIFYNTFFLSKTKFRNLIISIIIIFMVFQFAPAAWFERMNTIGTYQKDSSAMGRVAVWAWTLEYVSTHPWGGGFGIAMTSHGIYEGVFIHGKAFHNIYFEVLGEQGYFGLIIYVLILLTTVFKFIQLILAKNSQTLWVPEMAKTGLMVMLILMIGGLTIGIAFQPYIYYFVGLSICLDQINARSKNVPPAQRI